MLLNRKRIIYKRKRQKNVSKRWPHLRESRISRNYNHKIINSWNLKFSGNTSTTSVIIWQWLYNLHNNTFMGTNECETKEYGNKIRFVVGEFSSYHSYS